MLHSFLAQVGPSAILCHLKTFPGTFSCVGESIKLTTLFDQNFSARYSWCISLEILINVTWLYNNKNAIFPVGMN